MTDTTDNKPIVAAFDFDGTITYRDSMLPFLIFAVGPVKCFFNLLAMAPTLLAYCVGQASRQTTKEATLTRFFRGIRAEKLCELGATFAKRRLNYHVKPEALRRIEWHQSQGHRCILVSAAVDAYIEPWGRSVGFDDVLCSVVEVDDRGCVTGALNGLNCRGPEKTRRLEQLLGARSGYTLYAYGDSKGDMEMLASADYPFYRKMPILERISKCS